MRLLSNHSTKEYLEVNSMIKESILSESEDGDRKAESGNVAATAVYVKELAHELAELARSAGCSRLSTLLRLAALEAQLCLSSSTWEGMEL
jgi:hypothetical protein